MLDMPHPLVVVNIRFINQIDSLLEAWAEGKSIVDLLSENTMSMLIWMNLIEHSVLVVHFNQFF